MRRNLYDVERWYTYLYRRAKDTPYADDLDPREVRFEDELFARVYDGAAPAVPDANKDDAAWSTRMFETVVTAAGGAQAFQATCDACKGDVQKTVAAMDDLLDKVPKAASQDPTARDASDGLSGVQFGSEPWTGRWEGETAANQRAKDLAERLRDSERLKKIADLAGKFKRVALTKQKVKVRHAPDEITDVVFGRDLSRLLPTELARIASPRRRLAALRDLMEGHCLEYEVTGSEVLGRGPLVLCVDKSGSMAGDKDVWACAVALALLDIVQRQRRTFILLGFNDDVFQRVIVKPGRPLPEAALLTPCSGDTDVNKVLDLALRATETRAVMRRADIVVVTDGQSDTSASAWIRQRAKARDVKIIGVGIGVGTESLTPWCDETTAVEDVSQMDDGVAETIFNV